MFVDSLFMIVNYWFIFIVIEWNFEEVVNWFEIKVIVVYLLMGSLKNFYGFGNIRISILLVFRWKIIVLDMGMYLLYIFLLCFVR